MTKIVISVDSPHMIKVVGLTQGDLQDSHEVELFKYSLISFGFLIEGLDGEKAISLNGFVELIKENYTFEIGTKTAQVVNFLKILDARVKASPERNSDLDRLKEEALESTTFRGHQMKPWKDYGDGKQSMTLCSICERWVTVNTDPMPNEIDVGGSAVAMTCDGGE